MGFLVAHFTERQRWTPIRLILRQLLSRDLDRWRIRYRHTVEGLVYGLPGERVGINRDIDGAHRQFPAIGPDAVAINAPFLAFPGPNAAAEPTLGLEDP